MSYYKLSNGVVIRGEEFGGLLFDRRLWNINQVNQTSYLILQLLARKIASREFIYHYLSQIYEGINENQMPLINTFIDHLLHLKIIEEADALSASISNKDFEIYRNQESEIQVGESLQTARYLSAPIFVWWDITAVCNLKCRQCYSSSGKPLPDEMTITEVLATLKELARMKVFYIYFLGGEPFMRKNFLEILGYCQSLGLEVMINTNGWFVTKQIASELAQLGVRHVRVSIDGATAQTHDAIRGVPGSFNRATAAVTALKSAEIPIVGVSPTMMSTNCHEAEALIGLAHNLGADEIQLVQVCAVGRGQKSDTISSSQALELKDTISRKSAEIGNDLSITGSEGVWEKPFARCVLEEKVFPGMMGCGAGRTCLAIAPNGKVRACLLFQHEVGDLKTADFQQIWMGENYPRMQGLRSVKEGCTNCAYASVCSGPCPMQQLISSEQRERFVKLKQYQEREGYLC